jgi:hypothetical protein
MRSCSHSIQLHLIERRVLCALCGGAPGADADLIVKLNSYQWMDAEHRIVFEALSKILPCDALSLQELLPAQATRMGFPDVDWRSYFAASGETSDPRALANVLMKAST